MLSDSDVKRLQRLVNLAPLMDREQLEQLLELIRKLKAAEAASIMPESAIDEMRKAVDDKLMSEIVRDLRKGPAQPSSIAPARPSAPVVRGTGWQEPKNEDRSRQFQLVDDIVNYWAGGPNDTSKLR